MLFILRVEVASCCSKGGLTLADLMNVKSMIPGGKAVDGKRDQHAAGHLHKCSNADVLAFRIFQFRLGFGLTPAAWPRPALMRLAQRSSETKGHACGSPIKGEWPMVITRGGHSLQCICAGQTTLV